MTNVLLRHPGAESPVSLSLSSGEVVLVGRKPDITPFKSLLDGWRVSVCALDDDAVSSNHLLLWCQPDGVWAQDLGSRNGTWARLSPRLMQLAGAEVQIDLAVVRRGESLRATAFPPPGWTGREDFAARMVTAIRAWVAEQGLAADVEIAHGEDTLGVARFALATRESIAVRLSGSGTLDVRFPELMEAVAEFVEAQNALLDEEGGHEDGFVLRAPAFRDAHRRVYDAAVRGQRLLLLGASGTGKERLAECYHRHSPRRDGPFKAINCALVDRSLIWAQLFGARRGAFTGATHDLKGAVESAHGGTLFLDEVAELDATTQAALLRFLDRRGEYERLGDTTTRTADVRIVCATNRDLRAAVRDRLFREDLWFRFAGTVVDVPPLRERPEDLLGVLSNQRLGRTLTVREALADNAVELLLRHPWSGNFRELFNFVQRLPTTTVPGSITRAQCERCLAEGAADPLGEMRSSLPAAPVSSSTWDGLLSSAARSWREDHDDGDPETLGDIKDFVESYLKPVFAAHASGVANGARVEGLNWSALGRRLAVADGTTVKRWVERYVTRFRR